MGGCWKWRSCAGVTGGFKGGSSVGVKSGRSGERAGGVKSGRLLPSGGGLDAATLVDNPLVYLPPGKGKQVLLEEEDVQKGLQRWAYAVLIYSLGKRLFYGALKKFISVFWHPKGILLLYIQHGHQEIHIEDFKVVPGINNLDVTYSRGTTSHDRV